MRSRALLVAASQISAGAAKDPAGDTTTVGVARPAASFFTGIAQRGGALGSPTAPVTLLEYADLQCPYCARWARETLPVLVDRYVRTGKLRIVFRGLAFIGRIRRRHCARPSPPEGTATCGTSFTPSTSDRAPRTAAG